MLIKFGMQEILEVLEKLKVIKPVPAVYGNIDGYEFKTLLQA